MKLTTAARKALPDSDFIFPETRSYPYQDEGHARAALQRVEEFGTPAEKSRVRSAVRRRYPGIEQTKGIQGHLQSMELKRKSLKRGK